MARANRVSPLGELIATPARGLVYGNRGCLHDELGRIKRDHAGRRWIACRLEFRGRRRSPLLASGRYTELFFLDEVTALAAGHRPCAECRRGDYERLRIIWTALYGAPAGAQEIDARLHAERLQAGGYRGPGRPGNGSRRLHDAALDELPDGAMILHDGRPWLVCAKRLLAWTPAGYAESRPRTAGGRAAVITPPSLLSLLRSGWAPLVPLVHPSAHAGLARDSYAR